MNSDVNANYHLQFLIVEGDIKLFRSLFSSDLVCVHVETRYFLSNVTSFIGNHVHNTRSSYRDRPIHLRTVFWVDNVCKMALPFLPGNTFTDPTVRIHMEKIKDLV